MSCISKEKIRRNAENKKYTITANINKNIEKKIYLDSPSTFPDTRFISH